MSETVGSVTSIETAPPRFFLGLFFAIAEIERESEKFSIDCQTIKPKTLIENIELSFA